MATAPTVTEQRDGRVWTVKLLPSQSFPVPLPG
jgi:hypothetical protein